jgi:hypothetical protein
MTSPLNGLSVEELDELDAFAEDEVDDLEILEDSTLQEHTDPDNLAHRNWSNAQTLLAFVTDVEKLIYQPPAEPEYWPVLRGDR